MNPTARFWGVVIYSAVVIGGVLVACRATGSALPALFLVLAIAVAGMAIARSQQ